MTGKLLQIMRQDQEPIPPLSQSKQGDMACALLYIARHVHHVEWETEPSRRGIEIHRLIAQYMDSLGISKQKVDPAKMAELAAEASEAAREVVDRFPGSYSFEHEKIYDTELYIAADEEFKIVQKREDATYEGTLDLVVMESPEEATIYDWKSFYQIIDADTFQSRMYPLLLFLLNPSLKKVTFKLCFVRYGDATREATWTSDDVPKLKKLVAAERARQVRLHNTDPEKLEPTPGRQCTYCPLLLNGCPMQTVNPYASLDRAQRVGLAVWMAAAKIHNDQVIKDWLIEGGPIEYRDANGVRYVAGFEKRERRSYPLDAAANILIDWVEANPADRDLMHKLSVGGLSSPLKAKKRTSLAASMEGITEVNTVTQFKIGRPGEIEDDDETSKPTP